MDLHSLTSFAKHKHIRTTNISASLCLTPTSCHFHVRAINNNTIYICIACASHLPTTFCRLRHQQLHCWVLQFGSADRLGSRRSSCSRPNNYGNQGAITLHHPLSVPFPLRLSLTLIFAQSTFITHIHIYIQANTQHEDFDQKFTC